MTTRRNFFKLMAGAALAPVAAKAAAILADVPILYGDGVHDDAPALNALIRGEVVEFMQPDMAVGVGWVGDYLRMPSGAFRVRSTVQFDIGDDKEAYWGWLHLVGDELGKDEPAISFLSGFSRLQSVVLERCMAGILVSIPNGRLPVDRFPFDFGAT